MPKLHDRTRRNICLTAFFAFCILPTFVLLAWGLSRHGDWHVAAYAERLSQQLALKVSIEDVEHPRPGIVRCVGVCFADPETDEPICSCRRVEARFQAVKGRPLPAVFLFVDGAEVRHQRADRFWQLLQRTMTRRMSRDDVDLRLIAKKLALRNDEGIDLAVLGSLKASMQTDDKGGQAEFNFQLSEARPEGAGTREPVQIRVRRDRTAEPPSLCFDVNSHDAPIPCALLGLLLPECNSLGPFAKFQGYFFAQRESRGWSGRIVGGQISGIDPEEFLRRYSPHTLTGRTVLSVKQADFSGGRLQNAVGSIKAGPGTIGRAFFDNASMQLRLPARSLSENGSDAIAYESLAFDFTIDNAGLKIQGAVDGAVARVPVIMADAAGPLLGEPEIQPQTVAVLLQTLIPESQLQPLPDERAQRLSRRLPLPGAGERLGQQ